MPFRSEPTAKEMESVDCRIKEDDIGEREEEMVSLSLSIKG